MNRPSAAFYRLKENQIIPTPNLLLYPELVLENINQICQLAPSENLRPHVKTNKCAHIVQLMLEAGITKFKCATLQEARMLASLAVEDILIAFPIVGDQLNGLVDLQKEFPRSSIKIIVDSADGANQLQAISESNNLYQQIFIDINLGMNRTGVVIDQIDSLMEHIYLLRNIEIVGLHGYDGHIREESFQEREEQVKPGFDLLLEKVKFLEKQFNLSLKLVFGGTNTFPIYRQYPFVECSPGTFTLWDWGYHTTLPEQTFQLAAMLVCRVVSKPNNDLLCLDLGYKAIASENPIDKRLQFLDKDNWIVFSQSEEHLVVQVPNAEWRDSKIGDLVYVIPYHICPTVAIYPNFHVVDNGLLTGQWKIISRY